MAAKTLFSMQMTETQKEIMEYLIEFRHQGQGSKANYINQLILGDAMEFLGLPLNFMNELKEEDILQELKEHAAEEQRKIIAFIGEDKYNKLMEKYNQEPVKKDTKITKI